jgi:MFS transporter, DHA1 family, multidrug resistance protein
MYKKIQVPPFILFLLFSLSQSTESAFTTGLPQMADYFRVSPSLAQFTSSIYFYGFAIGILISGRLSDILGRRVVVLLGISVFLISTLSCFFSESIYELIIFRFFQAIGASVGSVVAQASARDGYIGDELSKLYASLSIGLSVMPSISAAIGSNITWILGWKYIFIYLFLTVLITYILSFFFYPETNNFKGFKNRHKFSKVLQTIVKDHKVICLAIIIGGFNGILYSCFIEAPFIFMVKLGVSSYEYGYIVLAIGISAAIGGIYSRYAQSKKVFGKQIIFNGLYFSLVATSMLFILSYGWSLNSFSDQFMFYGILAPIMLQSFCFGMVMPLALRYSLEDYSKVNGTAGAIFGASYYLIIATCNFITSKLHSEESILKVSFFFFVISVLCTGLYIYSRHFEEKNLSREKPFSL